MFGASIQDSGSKSGLDDEQVRWRGNRLQSSWVGNLDAQACGVLVVVPAAPTKKSASLLPPGVPCRRRDLSTYFDTGEIPLMN